METSTSAASQRMEDEKSGAQTDTDTHTWGLHAHELLQGQVCRAPGSPKAHCCSQLVELGGPSGNGAQPADAGHCAAARSRQLQVS